MGWGVYVVYLPFCQGWGWPPNASESHRLLLNNLVPSLHNPNSRVKTMVSHTLQAEVNLAIKLLRSEQPQ